MSLNLDSIDLKLLDVLQREIPLVGHPFAEIGKHVGIDEAETLRRVSELRSSVVRQISAIFDSRAIGYESSLVAAQIDPAHIDEAAEIISRHPGVSHNYQRAHAYNLWYTVAVPPDSQLGLRATVETLHELSGARYTRLMPALKVFKIGVKFDLSGDADATPLDRAKTALTVDKSPLTSTDKRMICVLQQDLPVISRPFDKWAREADVDAGDLLAAAQKYLDRGWMRRFSAVLRHRAAGISANAMGCWVVSAEERDDFGEIAGRFPAVSHCYERPTYPDWPYSIFTMVHGKQPAECEATLAAIADATGIDDYTALYSTHEYKKVRVRYFTPDIAQWEQKHLKAETELLI